MMNLKVYVNSVRFTMVNIYMMIGDRYVAKDTYNSYEKAIIWYTKAMRLDPMISNKVKIANLIMKVNHRKYELAREGKL